MAKETNDIAFHTYFKKYKKIFNLVCKHAKCNYNSQFIKKAENKNKAVWQVVNKEFGIKKKITKFV